MNHVSWEGKNTDFASFIGKEINFVKMFTHKCLRLNMIFVLYTVEARSVCLDEDGDLLSVRNLKEKTAIVERLSNLRESYVTGFWISLNDKDYRDFFYWSDDNANTLMSWGSGSPERTDYQTERNPSEFKYILNVFMKVIKLEHKN